MSDDMQARRSDRLSEYIKSNYELQKVFIEEYGFSQSEISTLINGKRSFGEKKARSIEATIGLPEGYLDREPANVTILEKQIRQVPLVSFVAAGAFENIQELDVDTYIPCPVNCSEGTFALRVDGLSMYDPNPYALKSFRPGEIIFCDPEVTAVDGSLVVVRLESESKATFKQIHYDEWGNMYLNPLNPDWPEQDIEVNEPAMICGVVIGKHVSF